MTAGLWGADWLARAWRERRIGPALGEALLVPGAGVLGLYLAGFFVLRGGFAGTWGSYGGMQLDLLAPFDPPPWGRLLPDLPGPEHLEVGHSYPGLGVLLLLLASAIAYAARPRPGLAARWPLILATGGMLLFAVSHHVSVAGREFVLFDLPDRALALLGALRASERFLWPFAYMVLAGAIAALVHAVGGRRAGLAMVALVGVQLLDLQPGFARLDRYFPVGPAVAPLRLAHPFWAEAATHYGRIRLHPTGMQARHWEEVAVYAATMGLETDAVYLARLDPERMGALNDEVAQRLEQGRYEPRTLYALGSEEAVARARRGMDPARDLLAELDRGVWVLAPGWHARR
jgi:hypothetical protein